MSEANEPARNAQLVRWVGKSPREDKIDVRELYNSYDTRHEALFHSVPKIFFCNFKTSHCIKTLMNKDDARELMAKIQKETYEIQCEVLEGGRLPSKKNQSDAGFDLFAVEDVVIYPGQSKKVPLNIKLKLPQGTWASITGKSGLGAQGLLVHAGVIDQDYRGIPHVVMANINVIERVDEEGYPIMRVTPIVVKKGEKLAQLIMNPFAPHFYITQVEHVSADTARGEGGFGSTGK